MTKNCKTSGQDLVASSQTHYAPQVYASGVGF